MNKLNIRDAPALRTRVEVSEPELSEIEQLRMDYTLSYVPTDAESALEIGFGDFRMTRRLAELLPTTVLDLPRAVPFAPDVGGVVFGTIASLPFTSGRFDLAVCCEVLEHLPDDVFAAAVQELQRVAARYVLITVPYKQRVWNERYRCPSCSIVWHYSDHCRTLDESLAAHFQGWKATVSTFGETHGYAPDFMYGLARSLGNVWAESPWGCHVCKASVTGQEPNALGRVLRRVIRRWQAHAGSRPIWMLLLLERTSD